MTAHALVNEFTKLRHLGIRLVAGVMVIGAVALSLVSALASSISPTEPHAWLTLLAGLSLAVALTSPLLIAVMASRQVEVEHHGNGWLLAATAGDSRGGLCRSKLVALGIVVTVATALQNLLVLGGGLALGITEPAPVATWLGFALCVLAVNLTLLAFHILFSACVENQLVGLGIGVLGTLIASFAMGLPNRVAHATPWGYYSLAQVADYRGGELVALSPSYASITALAAVAAVAFTLLTRRLDRQEA